MTSEYIRTHPETFSDFLLSPTTFMPLTPEEFCRQEVEPLGKEADHAQIMALAETLQIGIRVAYLDRSDVGNGEVINWVEFGPGTKEEDRPLTLLYRYVLVWSMELTVDLVISMWLRKTFCRQVSEQLDHRVLLQILYFQYVTYSILLFDLKQLAFGAYSQYLPYQM
jgi:hypothetical protein